MWKSRKFSLTHFICQKFRESNGFTRDKLLKRWFDEKKIWWERISRFSTVKCAQHAKIREIIAFKFVRLFHEISLNYVKMTKKPLFWQKFRESNCLTKEVTKDLISRNIFSVRRNFAFFHILGHLFLIILFVDSFSLKSLQFVEKAFLTLSKQ